MKELLLALIIPLVGVVAFLCAHYFVSKWLINRYWRKKNKELDEWFMAELDSIIKKRQ